jgi:hypothetical protein
MKDFYDDRARKTNQVLIIGNEIPFFHSQFEIQTHSIFLSIVPLEEMTIAIVFIEFSHLIDSGYQTHQKWLILR